MSVNKFQKSSKQKRARYRVYTKDMEEALAFEKVAAELNMSVSAFLRYAAVRLINEALDNMMAQKESKDGQRTDGDARSLAQESGPTESESAAGGETDGPADGEGTTIGVSSGLDGDSIPEDSGRRSGTEGGK